MGSDVSHWKLTPQHCSIPEASNWASQRHVQQKERLIQGVVFSIGPIDNCKLNTLRLPDMLTIQGLCVVPYLAIQGSSIEDGLLTLFETQHYGIKTCHQIVNNRDSNTMPSNQKRLP